MARSTALTSALRFKEVEAELHGRALDAFATGAQAFTATERAVVGRIHAFCTGQLAELRSATGTTSAPASPDFSAGSGSGTGPFRGALGGSGMAPYTGATKREYFKLAQLFGDFGVRLLLAGVSELAGDVGRVELATRILASQGRQAAELRAMRSGANREPIDESASAYTALIHPWVGVVSGRAYDNTAQLGYGGAPDDPLSQAFVALLVYGDGIVGSVAWTTPQTSEANQVQFSGGPYNAEAFDEPIDAESATEFLARFGVQIP